MSTQWEIDWKRVRSVEDMKLLLMSLDLRPRPAHPDFENYKHLCRLIDDDGREVPEQAESASN